MSWEVVPVTFAVLLALYALLVVSLLLVGRRGEARALAAFIPDCVVLLRRLLADERMPRSRKAAVLLLIAYLAMPFDLIPDFIPVLGQFDDAIIVALVLRFVLRGAGLEALDRHWLGSPGGARMIERLAWGSPRGRREGRDGGGRADPRGAVDAGGGAAPLPPPAPSPRLDSPPTRRTRSAPRSGSSSPG